MFEWLEYRKCKQKVSDCISWLNLYSGNAEIIQKIMQNGIFTIGVQPQTKN